MPSVGAASWESRVGVGGVDTRTVMVAVWFNFHGQAVMSTDTCIAYRSLEGVVEKAIYADK